MTEIQTQNEPGGQPRAANEPDDAWLTDDPALPGFAQWLVRPWAVAIWAVALLLATVAVSYYLNPGIVVALLVAVSAGTMLFFPKRPEQERLPPPAARLGAGAAHSPGPDRTGDAVVDGFIGRLAALSRREWFRVLRPRLSRVGSVHREIAMRRAHARLRKLLADGKRQDERDAIARGVRGALAGDERLAAASFYGPAYARMAATALLLRDALSEAELRALYSPFEPVIPRASLHDAAGESRVLDRGDETPRIVAAHEQSITGLGEVYRKPAE